MKKITIKIDTEFIPAVSLLKLAGVVESGGQASYEIEQGFSYANKNGSKCGWVIVSNFVEIRLYKSNSSLKYELFDMRNMKDEKEFLRLYYFLCKDHLIEENTL